MSKDELGQIQNEIDDYLENNRVEWLRLATAGFDPEERRRIREGIASSEAGLMSLLERKWAFQRDDRIPH